MSEAAIKTCGTAAIGLSALYLTYSILVKKFKSSADVKLSCPPLVMCGPSAVGKGTLIDMAMKEFSSAFMKKISHTTRKPRAGEVNGVHYHFTTKEKMTQEISEGKFIEHAEVHGNMYGTSVDSVQSIADKGAICLLEVDIQGVEAIRKTQLNPLYIFVFPLKFEVLEARMRARGSETEETIKIRLATAKTELAKMEAAQYTDLKLYNDDLDQSYAKFRVALLSYYPQLKIHNPPKL